MAQIVQLDPHIADLIAAGEVVERPASVAKELLENAVDAGARAVTVEIQSGGMTFLRVTDDGCGMEREDAKRAFLRHATSKIRTAQDLEAIGTLGFRGEALAAIVAVARVSLLTCPKSDGFGTSLYWEGGVLREEEEAGGPQGTTIVVRDLFYNTPARQKFMKRDAAEGAAVFAVVQRIALSHPELSVKFIREGRQELLTPGDGNLRSAVYSVLGRDLALGFIETKGTGEGSQVSGFVSMPTCCRGTRGYQHFFVNGRYVKSRVMTAAVEEAYANQKMVGKFPACVLHLEVNHGEVDVNVHPTKTEVKFQNDKAVFHTVYYAVLGALDGEKSHRGVKSDALLAPKDEVTPNQMTMAPTTMTTAEYRANRGVLPVRDGLQNAPIVYRNKVIPPMGAQPRPSVVPQSPPFVTPAVKPPVAPPPPPPVVEKKAVVEKVPEPQESWRVAGEVLNTYIVVEQGEKILFIDKHAAHERMHFDRLKAEGYRPMIQDLMVPQAVTLTAEEGAILQENTALLHEFGFVTEPFGGNTLLVRSAPFDIGEGEVETVLAELAGKLLATGRADPASARDALLHTMACKAAIKGGQKNGTIELDVVARAVMNGEVKYCPHGRPVAVELTRGQLEKQFGRA